ncbi:hypothetical protein KC345_g3230 [Hortaea werneckii]|nr:hypothetical protein KC345_g3230 [Hortaea werneckii]
MKCPTSFVAAFAALNALAMSQNTSDSAGQSTLAEMADALPSCALNCLATLIPQSTCSLTDLNCICTDPWLNQQSTVCLGSNCTVVESLETKNYQEGMCGAPVRDRSATIPAVNWPLYAVAALSVAFRFLARSDWAKGAGYWWDDWSILVALCLITAGSSITTEMAHLGLGKDMWTLKPSHISDILFYFWIDEFLYIATLSITKISILSLYLRIFPSTVSNRFRIATFTLMAISIIYAIVLEFIILFSCEPIDYFWHMWDGEHEGNCLNTNAEIFAGAGVNIAIDIVILVLPIPKLLGLEVSFKKKIGICLTFLVGGFSIICSIVRLQYLVQWGNTTNPTWDYTQVAIWSSVEGAATIICACMPQMAGPVKRLYGRTVSKVSSAGSKKYGVSGSSGSHALELSRRDEPPSKSNAIAKTVSVSATYDGRSQRATSEEELVGRSEVGWPSNVGYAHDYRRQWSP